MNCNRVYLGILPALLGLMAGCGESKISQCDRLIQPIEQTTLEAKSAVKKPQNLNIGFVQRASSITDKAALKIGAIELKDAKLKEYQSALVKLYKTNSQGTQAFIQAFAQKDRIKAIQALDIWKKNGFSDRERQLITQINTYCFSKE